ncbi:hypothetical protein COV18_04670 [Candidatus Woesearchaeota archaeon CG10_big_fil_rev_8_21_14_0_10_37_12]|nr:MAG: hypothetical protein COV18_04670 [Candidatus Woesearchaeota archaeon CG10_big_fil_rev_8_21_14_0_10_37_12]
MKQLICGKNNKISSLTFINYFSKNMANYNIVKNCKICKTRMVLSKDQAKVLCCKTCQPKMNKTRS